MSTTWSYPLRIEVLAFVIVIIASVHWVVDLVAVRHTFVAELCQDRVAFLVRDDQCHDQYQQQQQKNWYGNGCCG